MRGLKILLTVALVSLVAGGAYAAQMPAASQSGEGEINIMNYKAPTGPEMTPLAAVTSAIRFARGAEQYGELAISVSHSTFAQAQAVVESRAPSTANMGGVAEIAEWRESPVYLVEFKTTTPGEKFTPNVSVPPGRKGPSGEVMALIVDAHTGALEGRHIGSKPLSLSELGPVATMSVPAESATAFAASARARERAPGYVEGRLYVRGHPKSGWQMTIARSSTKLGNRFVKTLNTEKGGLFITRLHPGSYVIGARARGARGKLCGVQRLTIRPRTVARTVTVAC